MILETGNKDAELKPDKGFFAYIREVRNSFKKFVSDAFSAKEESSSRLDGLKKDIFSNVDEENVKKTDTKHADGKIDLSEKESKGLKDKLKEICVRSRKY